MYIYIYIYNTYLQYIYIYIKYYLITYHILRITYMCIYHMILWGLYPSWWRVWPYDPGGFYNFWWSDLGGPKIVGISQQKTSWMNGISPVDRMGRTMAIYCLWIGNHVYQYFSKAEAWRRICWQRSLRLPSLAPILGEGVGGHGPMVPWSRDLGLLSAMEHPTEVPCWFSRGSTTHPTMEFGGRLQDGRGHGISSRHWGKCCLAKTCLKASEFHSSPIQVSIGVPHVLTFDHHGYAHHLACSSPFWS